MADQNRLVEELLFALANKPESVSIIDAREYAKTLRKSKNRPSSQLIFNVSDDVLLSVKGAEDRAQWRVAMVAIRADALDRMDSPIHLPNERRMQAKR